MTLRASRFLLGALCGFFAQPAAAQEYQLNQWHLSLANGLQATLSRETGGSEWTAQWEVPAPPGGEVTIVQARSLLQHPLTTDVPAFLMSYDAEPGDCRALEPPPSLRGRRVVAAFCTLRGHSVLTGIIDGAYDGLQVRFGVSFRNLPVVCEAAAERLAMTALSSITRLEETRPFDWSDVQCGAFHPVAHAGAPRPTFYCAWDGQNRLTYDACQEPEDHRPWAGCDWGTYTEAAFAEIGADAQPLVVYALGVRDTLSIRTVMLRGPRGRFVRLGVRGQWPSQPPRQPENIRRFVAFIGGATVAADPIVVRSERVR